MDPASYDHINGASVWNVGLLKCRRKDELRLPNGRV